jgi:hypothetical protein
MSQREEPGWSPLGPAASGGPAAETFVTGLAKELATASPEPDVIRAIRVQAYDRLAATGLNQKALRVSVAVLCDLRMHGWEFRVDGTHTWVRRPQSDSTSALAEKLRVRTAHLHERTVHLREPSPREFIAEMERRRLLRDGWISIFSLMRDGRELADTLRSAAKETEPAVRWAALRRAIDPYLQFVDADSFCHETGLRTADIWRYFSYTWSNLYRGVPGRKMWIIVRDRAVRHHPVIGIAALASSVVQQGSRDAWIGWRAQEFIAELREKPSRRWAQWLAGSLDGFIASIYVKDFLAEGILARRDIRNPNEHVVGRLLVEAAAARRRHQLYPHAGQHKTAQANDDWEAQAQSHLFRWKRAEELAQILDAKRRLVACGFSRPTRECLARALANAGGRRAVEVVLRHVKASKVGVNMLDIIICGAVAPYNHILGGKLVSLLMASPEVVKAYEKRYGETRSIIASSMAGRPIRRKPKLVLLNTTSLYGVASSQYNRLVLPAEAAGGRPGALLEFRPLGRTVGWGSFHLSSETVDEIEHLLAQSVHGRVVNSIFGEGVNPRMRKIRAGLDAVGFPSDDLLKHGSPRLVYGVALASNFKEVLLGVTNTPRYIVPLSHPEKRSAQIAAFWIRRWLSKRIENNEVLSAVEAHTLIHPIEHGARVMLPTIDDEQLVLFSDPRE